MRKYFNAALAAVLALPFAAQAAIPTEAGAAVTGLITDAGDFIADLWPLLVAVVVGLLFMKIFKKGVSKAT